MPMSTETQRGSGGLIAGLMRGNAGPVTVVVIAILMVWYLAAIFLNMDAVRMKAESTGQNLTWGDAAVLTFSQDRPLLPAPHQIVMELDRSVLGVTPTSKRSLLYHTGVTVEAAMAGFAMGALAGIILAVLIVHVRTLEMSLMPWIISSQTIPILAIAPIVIVVFGSLGIRGLMPKALISAYLCFFPVTIGLVKGLTSPDRLQRDLMRTYSATAAQTFWKLRLPASVPFLFASLKVAVAISLVGAIVAELPTGAQAGLGARLLAGSYYGQTVQIWAALFAAAAAAAVLVAVIGFVERLVGRAMGVQPARGGH